MSEDEAVAAAIRGLDRGGLTDFVASLWTARGWTVEREGDLLRVRGGGEERVLAPVPGSRLPGERAVPDGADAVVTPDAGAFENVGVEVIGPVDLGAMLRYGVPPETSERLCREHFGSPLDELALPASVRARRSLASLPLRRIGVSVALLVAVAMLAVTFPLNSLLATGAGPAGSNDTGSTAAPASVVEPVEEPPRTTIPRTEVDLEGLNESAVTPERVAAAHRSALYSFPYESSVTYTYVNVDGTTRTRSRTITQVGERFVEQVHGDGIDSIERYDNGTATFVATFDNGSRVYRRAAEDSPDPRNRSARRIGRYLTTGDLIVRGTSSVEGVRTVLVVGEGNSGWEGKPEWMTVTNYSVEAMFDRNGLIRRMTVDYRTARGTDARVTWRYRELGLGEFEAPSWYEREFGT